MIIDSPIISGSYAATGSLNQTGDVVITGSLTVTGTINGSITGSITTASYALNAETLDGLDSTSFVTTSSFNTVSGSFSTRVTNLESFSSSLDATFATDAELAAVSQSLSSSLSIVSGSLSSRVTNNEVTGSSLTTASSSFSIRVTNNEATGSSLVTASGSFSTRTTNLETASGSFSTRVTNIEATASNLTTASSSFSTRVTNTEATASSLVTASGSFSTRTTNLETASGSFSTRTTNLESASGSFSTRVTNTEATASSLVTASGSFSTRTTNLETASGSFSTRVTSAESSITSLNSRSGSFATTGSNRFIGNQTITGSLTITENLTVLGSSSISYVSQSTLNIGTNLITVNAQNPSVRFGGLAVIDSGSVPQVSGSWLFDSIQNRWIMIHQQTAGGAVTSSIALMGPETYNNLGSETQITQNRLVKGVAGASGEHVGDSNISDTGTVVSINSNTQITGSLLTTSTVGIGTTNTYYSNNLIVAAGSEGGITIANPGTTGAQYLMFADGTSGNDRFRGYLTYNHTDNSLGLATDANIRLSITSTGAATFSSTVTAGGNFLIPAGSGLAWSGDTSRIMTPEDNVSGALIQTPGIIRFNAGGSEKVRITSGGDVLVGDTTPAARLWARRTDDGNTFGVRATNATYSATVGFFGADRNTTNNSFYYIDCYNYGSSSYRFRVADSGNVTSAGSATFAGTIAGGGNLELTNAGGPYVLVGEGTGVNQYGVADWDATNNILRIATQPYAFGANGGQLNLTTGGNVLIGTTNTGADGLSINNQRNLSFAEGSGESYANVFRQRNTAATVVSSGYKRSLTGLFASSFSSAMARAAIAVGYNNGSIAFFTDPSSTVANGTDIVPNERVTILNNGNVGIGTTSPGAPLEVIGNIQSKVSANTSSPQLVLIQTGGNTYSAVGINRNDGTGVAAGLSSALVLRSGDATDYPIQFATANNVRMTIASGGNVGIGTTNPSEKLTINNTADNTTLLLTTVNGNGRHIFSTDSSSNARIRTGNNVDLRLGVNEDAIIIRNGGNVGIGTTNPAFKLEVNGNISSVGLFGKSYSQTSSSGTTSIIDTGLYFSSFGSGGVWILSYGGNPNAAGSFAYLATYYGAIHVTTGFIGGTVKHLISYNAISQADSTNVGALTCAVTFWNGTTETTTINFGDTNYQIRIKITGFNSSFVGAYQYVQLTKVGG